MCGIGGVMKMAEEAISPSEIQVLGAALESRGRHATGVAAISGERVAHLKAAERATTFFSDKATKLWLEENLPLAEVALVHTRLATKGPPSVNNNNHPLCSGGTAVIHNGMINNDDERFAALRLTRSAQTDSDIIRAILDNLGMTREALKDLSTLSGSASIAAIHPEFPHQVLLCRSGNPLHVGVGNHKIYFASTAKAIHQASHTWVRRWGLWAATKSPDLAMCEVPNDSAWLLGPQGLIWHQEMKLAAYTYSRSYHGSYSGDSNYWWNLTGGSHTVTAGTYESAESAYSNVIVTYACETCKKDIKKVVPQQEFLDDIMPIVLCPVCHKEMVLSDLD